MAEENRLGCTGRRAESALPFVQRIRKAGISAIRRTVRQKKVKKCEKCHEIVMESSGRKRHDYEQKKLHMGVEHAYGKMDMAAQ